MLFPIVLMEALGGWKWREGFNTGANIQAFAGFATGLLISVFSKTLVLLAGMGMVIAHVCFMFLFSSISPHGPIGLDGECSIILRRHIQTELDTNM